MRKLIDKTVRPMTTVVNLSPGQAVASIPAGSLGNLPIGYYRGAPAFWDLDKAVVQPLVSAEREHILGNLDGRTLAYDRIPVTFTAAEAIALQRRARLTVPAGQVWYVQAVQLYAAKDTTATFDVNFRCSLWPDIVAAGVTPDVDGQAYLGWDGVGTNAINIWNFLFGVPPVTTNIGHGSTDALYLGNDIATPKTQPALLRLPAGAVLTAQVTVRTNVIVLATIDVTMSIYGFVGKALVN